MTVEQRFERTPDGSVWTSGQSPYTFWKRYLTAFERVNVVARVRETAEANPAWRRVDGDCVSVVGVPYFIGPQQYLLKRGQVKAVLRRVARLEGAFILRVDSTIGSELAAYLRRDSIPYGVEVITDPYDIFAPGNIRHPLRPVFRRLFAYQLRKLCANAAAASYVTEHYLQRRYPCRNYSTAVSDVMITPAALVDVPRSYDALQPPYRLVFVGSLQQPYKAADVLLEAMALCRQKGLDFRLTLVGEGRYRPELEAQAGRLGIAEQVVFAGQLPGADAVRGVLDTADVFVLPSRTEGLPRAVVEAMARGLPCISTTVGGIPELLPPEDLVPPNDAPALAERIMEVLAQPARMARMSARNRERAKDFSESILVERREAFFAEVKAKTQAWMAAHPRRT